LDLTHALVLVEMNEFVLFLIGSHVKRFVIYDFRYSFCRRMASRYPGFGSRNDDNEYKEDLVTIGTHFDPLEPTNSTSILATLGRKASKLVDLSASNYGYDGKRFHGAFTGGFNAGFYNTVGSAEGWRPSEFRASRSERAGKRSYEPEDFMDKGVCRTQMILEFSSKI